jgi:hypothetical protein
MYNVSLSFFLFFFFFFFLNVEFLVLTPVLVSVFFTSLYKKGNVSKTTQTFKL